MKKALAVFLSILMLLSVCAVGASAASVGDSGTFSVFCYNVAGLPTIDFLTGGEDKDVMQNQIDIGRYVEEKGYDIFATQEDFGYHDNLVAQLTSYQYATQHHGGVPSGDGTNVFTKTYKMYNEKHIPWNTLAGLVEGGADEFSQKGITYVCIEIADGVLVDFYDIHADAYGDEDSQAARLDNFTQLKELIDSRTVDRPVIVTGDFNVYLLGGYDCGLKDLLIDECGLKDSWVELYNNGNYTDASYYKSTVGGTLPDKWGNWDSVERFLYKDGGGIHIDCTSFKYVDVMNRYNKSASDHNAAEAMFSYTVTAESGDQGDLDSGHGTSNFQEFIRKIVAFFKALFLAFSNFDTIKEQLQGYFS